MCDTHPIVPNKYRGTTTYYKVFSKLIQAACEQQPIYYEEDVATIMGLQGKGNYMAKETGRVIGEISEDEYNQVPRRPMLSAVVVNKTGENKGIPGDGFFTLACQLGKLGEDATDEEKRNFWEKELNQVYEIWSD